MKEAFFPRLSYESNTLCGNGKENVHRKFERGSLRDDPTDDLAGFEAIGGVDDMGASRVGKLIEDKGFGRGKEACDEQNGEMKGPGLQPRLGG